MSSPGQTPIAVLLLVLSAGGVSMVAGEETETAFRAECDPEGPVPCTERFTAESAALPESPPAEDSPVYMEGVPELGLDSYDSVDVELAEPVVPSSTQDDPDSALSEPATAGYLGILGEMIPPGERRYLRWTAGQSFAGQALNTPVEVIHGRRPGPALCLTAAIHGDELNGVEIVRRLLSSLDPQQLTGTVIGVPIVNLLGFTRGSRYLPDRRDLNRYFPGNPTGSAASRIAFLFFEQIVRHCDYLVDFHTGSLNRTNLPQLRADLGDYRVMEFTRYFGATAVLHYAGQRGTLRRAATDASIAAVTFELGEPATLQPEHVEFGVKALETLMNKLGMVKRPRRWASPQPIYYTSHWIRADRGGILITSVKLGARVRAGDLLGTITNPLSNESTQILASGPGRVLGMALNQFVLPGFAAFHIGAAPMDSEYPEPADWDVGGDTEQAPSDLDGGPDDEPHTDDRTNGEQEFY